MYCRENTMLKVWKGSSTYPFMFNRNPVFVVTGSNTGIPPSNFVYVIGSSQF